MGLTSRPSKTFDLSKIDEIQNEFFNDEKAETEENSADEANKVQKNTENISSDKPPEKEVKVKPVEKKSSVPKPLNKEIKDIKQAVEPEQGSLKIADLLSTAKFEGVRHTSRPYTVPRSLTIDLTRLKSRFRTRNLQYTQNELMDKMLRESLEIVTTENFDELREKAWNQVKSPEQCSRRSVTLTEETVSEMNELKAALALKYNRRFSADEIFNTLLAIGFLPLYENELL